MDEDKQFKKYMGASLLFFGALLVVWSIILGCAKKQVLPTEPAKQPVAVAPVEQDVDFHYSVVEGDCLWNIAKKPDIYNDPFMWTLIYKANRDDIADPELIYPEQEFLIRKLFTRDEYLDALHDAERYEP